MAERKSSSANYLEHRLVAAVVVHGHGGISRVAADDDQPRTRRLAHLAAPPGDGREEVAWRVRLDDAARRQCVEPREVLGGISARRDLLDPRRLVSGHPEVDPILFAVAEQQQHDLLQHGGATLGVGCDEDIVLLRHEAAAALVDLWLKNARRVRNAVDGPVLVLLALRKVWPGVSYRRRLLASPTEAEHDRRAGEADGSEGLGAPHRPTHGSSARGMWKMT
eukprot:745595-Prymnesium_polylepis.2